MYAKHPQIIRIAPSSGGVLSATTNGRLTTIKTSTMPASKLLVLQQQNDCAATGISTTTTSTSSVAPAATTTTNYLHGQDNGGKIVLVTTEQMTIDPTNDVNTVTSNNGNDEELTSLTWLHDKNLLKGKRTFTVYM